MKANNKLYRKSRVSSVREMDSVLCMKRDSKAIDILMEAQRCWSNMDAFRRERERNKRYTYGDQWKDLVTVEGVTMSEEEYIKKQGNVPLKNNLIRRLVRNVLGVYRSQSKEPICIARDRDEQQAGETMSVVLQCNMQLNRMNEIYARTMEEFLISGLVVHKKTYGWRNDKMDCWTDYIQPNNFFIDSNMRDFRGWDVSMVGEIHDIDFGTLCREFAESPADYKRLSEIYSHARERRYFSGTQFSMFGYSRQVAWDFFIPTDEGRCRVIEVWRKESKPRYRCHDYNSGEYYKIDVSDYDVMVRQVNEDRLNRGVEAGMDADDIPLIEAVWFMDDYWYYYYLSPFGDILREGETPYAHKTSPYVFKAYPFIDGEIHSFVADVIDQQRYTNRLITLYDWIMRASGKGVLIVPQEAIGDMDLNEIADEWSRFNGVIAIKTKNGVPMPQQIAVNSTNIGISELLNLQLKFFEDISGVHGALQGKPGYSSTSGALYAQQTQNATMSLLDLLDSFSSFVKDSAYKDIKNIQQFYDEKRVFKIAGRRSSFVEYDPAKMRDVETDISIEESSATPAYRQIQNQLLLQMWEAGAISLEMMLENGDFPFADNLLQSLASQKQQMAQGQQPEGIPTEVMEQAQQGADMDAVNKAYEALRG